MKNISIPKPCSENWNEMTPSEKGAFCQKCALDVYDFTNKSGDEIRDILRLNIGSRVCGRIEPIQLEELNDDFMAWKMSNKQSFNRAWIFSLVVVFGLTLFSCEEDDVSVVQEIQKTAQSFLSDFTISADQLNTDFETKKESNQTESELTWGSHLQEPRIELQEFEYVEDILGELAYEEKVREPLVEVSDKATKGEVSYITHRLGGISSVSRFEEYLIETSTASCEVKLSGFTYPNPASNETTLKITSPHDGNVDIQLFSTTGQQIRSIHSGRIQKGESEYSVDLTDLVTGTYLFVIVSEGKKETVKFSKI